MNRNQSIRALLVENDDEDAAIFCRYASRLVSHSIDVVQAATAERALKALATGRFDLIFLDLNLGRGSGGMELLASIRAGGIDVPVIVVTGAGDEMKAVEAMKAGAYDYLVKDNLTADLLERTIRYARARCFLEEERARMVEELAELSVTDELTTLANRRRLTRKLHEEVIRSARTGHPFALLMIDLDHFKDVNDRLGHQVGDSVLRQCAVTLKKNLRGTDLLARYGGEEFCVVLPETSLQGGRHVAEKLRQAVADLSGPVPTISVGVAFWERHVSVEELVRRADEALYRAKEAGRNRVVLHGRD